MARLAGTAWLDPADGTVWEFSWVDPGEVMTWTSHRLDRDVVLRGAVNARGVVSFEAGSQTLPLTFQSSGVFVIGGAEAGWRIYGRATETRLSGEMDALKNGEWITDRTQEFQRLPASHVASAIAALAPKRAAYQGKVAANEAASRKEAAAKEAERKSPWGVVSALQGRRFVGNYDKWHTILTVSGKQFEGHDAISFFTTNYDELGSYEEIVFNDLTKGKMRLRGSDAEDHDIFFGSDGSFGYYHLRYRLLPDGSLEVTDGKWRKADSSFIPRKGPWIWRPYSDAENAQRIAQIQQSRSQSSGGDGGLGRVVGGALMGAMLGGGGQNSVDLAVAGAEAAAQGGNTLQVLNSMGNVAAAKASESQRQLNDSIARAQGGASGKVSPASGQAYFSSGSGGFSPAMSPRSLTKKTIQVYFEVGTTPHIATAAGEPDDGHNTHCQSNIFNVTIDWDPSLEADGGNLRYANALLDPMKSTFIDKCNRTDPSRPTVGIADWYADAWSGWHPESRQLRKGDLEVMMP